MERARESRLPRLSSYAEREAAHVASDVTKAHLIRDEVAPDADTIELVPDQELMPPVTQVDSRFPSRNAAVDNARLLTAVNRHIVVDVEKEVGVLDGGGEANSENAMPPFDATDGTNASLDMAPPIIAGDGDGALSNSAPAARKKVGLERDASLLCDYSQFDKIVYGAFPPLFPLASGLGEKVGPPDAKTAAHLLRHYRGPFNDQRFCMLLNNVKTRSDTSREATASVRSNEKSMQNFYDIVQARDYPERSAAAKKDPTSEDARKLCRELSGSVMIAGGDVPFSSLERGRTAASQLLSMIRFHGLPNVFLTIGPSETNNALVARLSLARAPGSETARAASRTTASAPAASAAHFWRAPGSTVVTGGAASSPAAYPDLARAFPGDASAAAFPELDEGVEVWRQEVGGSI